MSKKEYIGDGVYIQPGNFIGAVWLTCEDGIGIYEKIHLEPTHIDAINKYLETTIEEIKKEQGV